MESTVTRAPTVLEQSHTDDSERAGDIAEIDLDPNHADEIDLARSCGTNIANIAMESILSDFQERCQNNDAINQELEIKLRHKNQQLSETCVLLAESNENGSKLQYQLECEKREKAELKEQFKDLADKNSKLETSKQETDSAMYSLQQEKYNLDTQLQQQISITESLRQEIEEMKVNQRVLGEGSRTSIERLQVDKYAAEETISDLSKQITEHTTLVQKLKDMCTKEEKAKKQAEREVRTIYLFFLVVQNHSINIIKHYRECICKTGFQVKYLKQIVTRITSTSLSYCERSQHNLCFFKKILRRR